MELKETWASWIIRNWKDFRSLFNVPDNRLPLIVAIVFIVGSAWLSRWVTIQKAPPPESSVVEKSLGFEETQYISDVRVELAVRISGTSPDGKTVLVDPESVRGRAHFSVTSFGPDSNELETKFEVVESQQGQIGGISIPLSPGASVVTVKLRSIAGINRLNCGDGVAGTTTLPADGPREDMTFALWAISNKNVGGGTWVNAEVEVKVSGKTNHGFHLEPQGTGMKPHLLKKCEDPAAGTRFYAQIFEESWATNGFTIRLPND
jgi:hypothetical protein